MALQISRAVAAGPLRRARLVEYAIAVRLVTRDDLGLLDVPFADTDTDD